MPYTVLTEKTVVAYLLATDAGRAFFTHEGDAKHDAEHIAATEIGDGNLNHVFLVIHPKHPHRSLIVKQSLPYLRCLGEAASPPLEKERMHYEIMALEKFTTIAPARVPKIYHADREMCLVVMQYLGNHAVMRKGLIATNHYPKFADHLSTFLAEVLFFTSSLYLSSREKAKLIMDFNSNELRKMTEDYVFTFPFMPHPSNKISEETLADAKLLWTDSDFKRNVLRLKNLFMNQTDALLHGDLHTGSIMLNRDDTYIIDPEFAYVGPFGFDLGAVLANLVMSWVSHFERSHDRAYQEEILIMIQDFWNLFERKFIAQWNKHLSNSLNVAGFLSETEFLTYKAEFMQNMLRDAIGFAGCKIGRRQLGAAGVEDIRGISDPKSAARAERVALSIAREFVINHQKYNKIGDIIIALRNISLRFYPAFVGTTIPRSGNVIDTVRETKDMGYRATRDKIDNTSVVAVGVLGLCPTANKSTDARFSEHPKGHPTPLPSKL